MKKVTINIPDDCEVQVVRKESKFKKWEAANNPRARKVLKKIFNKEVEPVIRTYQDLIDNNKIISGYFISSADSKIIKYGKATCKKSHQNVASSEKVAKSMLAMATISQLMPYYGGAITDEEWKDGSTTKYTISRFKHTLEGLSFNTYYFLAFHTKEQRDNFLKYNEQLVKDYLMID